MKYTLTHKRNHVLDMEIDKTGFISKIYKIHDIKHLPLGVSVHKSGVDRKELNEWWLGRSIPASRDGIREALDKLNVFGTAELLDKSFGLSLSDQYWICPKDSGAKWDDINFFHNNFSKDVGEILFGHTPEEISRICFVSPDNTSDGWLRKKWIIAEGKRCLMKGGSLPYYQQAFNEVIASAVMNRLGVYHIPYTLVFLDNKPYSLCENFVTPDTELVPAWRVVKTLKKDNRDSSYTHLLRCCDHLGIPNAR